MIHRSGMQRLRRLYWAFRNQVCRRTWSFFVWEHQPPLPPHTQGRIILADRGDEAIGERMAVLRGVSADQHCAWLRAGHRLLYAVGPDNAIQSWVWFTVAEGGSRIAPFDFGIDLKIPPGVGFLWDSFTVPAYRRRGLYKTLLMQAVVECFAHGARRVWGHAQVTNRSHAIIQTTDHAGETTIEAIRVGPFCRISGPGFHRALSVGGVLEMDVLLAIGTEAEQPAS
jgi:GNAT superfamily N-acetyltransferase